MINFIVWKPHPLTGYLRYFLNKQHDAYTIYGDINQFVGRPDFEIHQCIQYDHVYDSNGNCEMLSPLPVRVWIVGRRLNLGIQKFSRIDCISSL